MKIHEYQAKELLGLAQIAVPPFFVARSLSDIEEQMMLRGWNEVVLKVQIHAGGRGKAGGVQVAKNLREALEKAKVLLSKPIVNEQTGVEGLIPSSILVSPRISIVKEFYIALILDRRSASIELIVSQQGGMEIETLAQEHPDKILKMSAPSEGEWRPYHLIRIAKFLGWEPSLRSQGYQILNNLLRVFMQEEATLLEINPLVLTTGNELLVLDAKMTLDESAAFRHPEQALLEDLSQISAVEAEARSHHLSYVALDGNIGCIVNGAGLAMATIDLIQAHGGKAANFLDIGGGASKEMIAEGFQMVLSDKNVKAILVNIFGGIMNCATLASGMVEVSTRLGLSVPVIVRMEGTQVEQARILLEHACLPIEIAFDLNDAAKKAIQAVRRIEQGGV